MTLPESFAFLHKARFSPSNFCTALNDGVSYDLLSQRIRNVTALRGNVLAAKAADGSL